MKRIKVLKQFPPHLTCPFCETNKSAKTLLIPIVGEGYKNVQKVTAVHRRCIIEHLIFDQETGIFFASKKVKIVKHKPA